jgi:arsenite-transporting ATPase
VYSRFDTNSVRFTKYLFFTGKGGVGKTSISCAVAVNLADNGRRVLLVSTDPASNLQDIFNMELNGCGVQVDDVPGLTVANLNPEEAAREYRDRVVGPYRGKLPGSVIAQMEEQLSGSCTVEIAAFDQFANFITDEELSAIYDHIIFDTAPTGHTLRMLQLPSAWSDFINESSHGASCLGQLAGLEEKKDIYRQAVKNLADRAKTAVILVARPEKTPLLEAGRTSHELKELGIDNQKLIINGLLETATDGISRKLLEREKTALTNIPAHLKTIDTYYLPLRSYNILGLENIRAFFTKERKIEATGANTAHAQTLGDLTEYLYSSGKKVVFTMGKGGVGKTVVASAIAISLARKGLKVHLASTDPASCLRHVISDADDIAFSEIDEEEELRRYQGEVLAKARETMCENDVAYIEEDLRSPCTQEIAVFRAFAEIVEKSESRLVVIDTAPTGHTLLLLDATLSYHKEVQRTKGETPPSVARLLPRLRDAAHTEVIIVTLPEATPVYEAARLKEDLKRAGISNTWWVVNQCLSFMKIDDPILSARAAAEKYWLNKVSEMSGGYMAALAWKEDATPISG